MMAGKKPVNLGVAFNPPASSRAPKRPLELVHDAAHLAVEQALHSPVQVPVQVPAPVEPPPLPVPFAATVAAPPDAAIPNTVAPAQANVVTPIVAATRQSAFAAMEKTMKSAEEFVSFGQGNLEAMMKSSQIWAAGFQDLSKSLAATAQAQLDQTVSSWKALAGVKSLKEAMDLQSSLARSSVETAVTETSKLTDASMKLAEQTLAPITARVSLAVEKFGRAA